MLRTVSLVLLLTALAAAESPLRWEKGLGYRYPVALTAESREVLDRLLQAGAQLNAQNDLGETPLLKAVPSHYPPGGAQDRLIEFAPPEVVAQMKAMGEQIRELGAKKRESQSLVAVEILVGGRPPARAPLPSVPTSVRSRARLP